MAALKWQVRNNHESCTATLYITWLVFSRSRLYHLHAWLQNRHHALQQRSVKSGMLCTPVLQWCLLMIFYQHSVTVCLCWNRRLQLWASVHIPRVWRKGWSHAKTYWPHSAKQTPCYKVPKVEAEKDGALVQTSLPSLDSPPCNNARAVEWTTTLFFLFFQLVQWIRPSYFCQPFSE